MAECHICGKQEDRDAVILRPVREVQDDSTGYQDVIYLCEECREGREITASANREALAQRGWWMSNEPNE